MSTLFIVGTPIGNLADLSFRAVEILKSVDLIAAEDTRHSQRLLQHYHIDLYSKKIISHHDHSSDENIKYLINFLKSGKSVALITDAGTPLISDPGYVLVREAHANNIRVVPIPGACAAIAALSVSGIASDKFMFEGFLPAARGARQSRLKLLKTCLPTLIFYEAPHRLLETLKDMCEFFGNVREASLGRELTKTFETVYQAPLGKLYEFVKNNPDQSRGESVLVIAGISAEELMQENILSSENLLKSLLQDLPLKKAVKITAELTNMPKNILYLKALELKD